MLAVHGGPGMSYDYLDDAVAELAARYRVATFQQRGLAPSTEQGEFTVAEAVADVAAVLDGLGWETAYLMGHSWGGHLVLHGARPSPNDWPVCCPSIRWARSATAGAEAFGAEMLARVPEADRERARVLEEKDTAGESTPEEDQEGLLLYWPSYFADAAAAPPMPPVRLSQPANQGLWPDLQARLPGLESSLSSITVPVGVHRRRAEPDAAERRDPRAADRIPGAWSHVEPGAGHFLWHEAPGSVLAAMDRLVTG